MLVTNCQCNFPFLFFFLFSLFLSCLFDSCLLVLSFFISCLFFPTLVFFPFFFSLYFSLFPFIFKMLHKRPLKSGRRRRAARDSSEVHFNLHGSGRKEFSISSLSFSISLILNTPFSMLARPGPESERHIK